MCICVITYYYKVVVGPGSQLCTLLEVWVLGVGMSTLGAETVLYTEDRGLQVPMSLEHNLLGRLYSLGVWPTISFQVSIKHTTTVPFVWPTLRRNIQRHLWWGIMYIWCVTLVGWMSCREVLYGPWSDLRRIPGSQKLTLQWTQGLLRESHRAKLADVRKNAKENPKDWTPKV